MENVLNHEVEKMLFLVEVIVASHICYVEVRLSALSCVVEVSGTACLREVRSHDPFSMAAEIWPFHPVRLDRQTGISIVYVLEILESTLVHVAAPTDRVSLLVSMTDI